MNRRMPHNIEIAAGMCAADVAAASPLELGQAADIAFAAALGPLACMAQTEGEQFLIGVGGLLLYFLEAKPDLVPMIQREMRILALVGKSQRGRRVDWKSVRESEGTGPLVLMALFRRSVGELGSTRPKGAPPAREPPAPVVDDEDDELEDAPVGGPMIATVLGEKRRTRCNHCGRERVFLGQPQGWRCLTCGGDRGTIEFSAPVV